MSVLSLVFNILWIVFGGFWMAAGWLLAAVVMALTVVGLPWARAALTFGLYTLIPFGRTAVQSRDIGDATPFNTGLIGTLRNLLWLILAGWWLALGHLATGVGLALTIIGLPFAWAHLKLALLSLWPVGYRIVTNDELDLIRRHGVSARSGL